MRALLATALATIVFMGCSKDSPTAPEEVPLDPLANQAFVSDGRVYVQGTEGSPSIQVPHRQILIFRSTGPDSGHYEYTNTIRALPDRTVMGHDTRIVDTRGTYHYTGTDPTFIVHYDMVERSGVQRSLRSGNEFEVEDPKPLLLAAQVISDYGLIMFGAVWRSIPIEEAEAAYLFQHPVLDAD